MRRPQHRSRLRRLEEATKRQTRDEQRRTESGAFPITLMQLHGLAPMSEADGARLRAWMLQHGWAEGEDGELARAGPRCDAADGEQGSR